MFTSYEDNNYFIITKLLRDIYPLDVLFCRIEQHNFGIENTITEPDLTDVHTIQSFPSSDAHIESCQPEGGCFPEDFNPRETSLSMVDNLTLT